MSNVVELKNGGIATSGDVSRFLVQGGVRYSHVLNPITGWPTSNSPRSVSVLANTCIEAGFLSTMAMLPGEQAQQFLELQNVISWLQW